MSENEEQAVNEDGWDPVEEENDELVGKHVAANVSIRIPDGALEGLLVEVLLAYSDHLAPRKGTNIASSHVEDLNLLAIPETGGTKV